MLDRAATCLKTTPQLPLQVLKRNRHSRRLLHSAFFRHGAGDLDLPTWCFHTMKALFEPYHTCGDGHDVSTFSTPVSRQTGKSSQRPTFLEFLYPPEAKAMIKRLSSFDLHSWEHSMQKLTSCTSTRRFGSCAIYHKKKAAVTGDQSAVAEGTGLEGEMPAQVQADALRILEGMISANERGQHTTSWMEAGQLYGRLDEAVKTPQFIRRMIRFLSDSPRVKDSRMAIRLFDGLQKNEKTGATYSTIIQACLGTQDFALAVSLHDEALAAGNLVSELEASRPLIAHLWTKSLWQVALHVYHSAQVSFGDKNIQQFQEWSRALFKIMSQMPGLDRSIIHVLKSNMSTPFFSEPLGLEFVRGIVGSFVKQGSGFGKHNLLALRLLKSIQLQNNGAYERLILLTLESQNSDMRYNLNSALAIYRSYRAEDFFKPSTRVLRSLLDRATKCNAFEIVAEIMPEWLKFHGAPPKALTGLLMKGMSSQGDTTRVKELLAAHTARNDDEDLELLYPLMHSHALRGEAVAVEQEFIRIQEKLKLRPDTTCWNILLHAYQRAQDLDGVLSVFARLLENSIEPDSWTFGTVMAIGADRGDVELCEQLLDMAKTSNVPRSAVMNECLITAYLNDNQADKAETVARSLTLLSRQQVTTRLWNQILIHHCLEFRPQNLKKTLHAARLMQKFNVPYDAYTYAAIMRAYVVKRRPDVARSILRQVVARKENVPVLALHYAIVMDGYANQLYIEKGLRMYAEMLSYKIEPTVSTRLALQRLHAQAAERKILIDRSSHPGLRLDVVDESLEEALASYAPSMLSNRDPQLQSSRFNVLAKYPGTYFDTPLLFYTKIRAFDTVKALLNRFEAYGGSTPLRFIMLLMNLRYRESDHGEVDRYWGLAKEAAVKAAKTAGHARGETYIPVVRRTILARHLDIVLRSLSVRGGSEAPGHMLTVVNDLFALGFDLDNENWNLYVQLLATRGQHMTAFALCERHLIAQTPAWRENEKRARFFQATGQKSRGTEYLGPRFSYIRPGELLVTFKTMTRLALVVRKLRRAAPFEADAAREIAELERNAPRTMRAVLEMPMKESPIATHVLGKGTTRGERRRVEA